MSRLAVLFLVLGAAFALFYANARTPDPLPATAPADRFSAGRAMADITVMGARPHPVGSPANAAVRDHLMRRMTALGLSPRVQREESQIVHTGPDGTDVVGAEVENVIGVLPGADRSLPALALMAHHDSVPGSPGAADDITGVAAALEIVRAIAALGPPRRDVILVITDGEEPGLLGAHAFFADDPLARHVGFLLNLEARGGGGRAIMFETSAHNGGAIGLFARSAARPLGNSLTALVYKLLPNDTDFTVARAHGVSGLNFAFIGRQFDYHSPSSTVAVLDQGSVQHLGEQALGVARAVATAGALPASAPDAVYGNLVGDWVVAYPVWGGWGLLAATAGLLALAAMRARRRGDLAWLDVAQGAAGSLLLLAGGALALHVVRRLTGSGFGWIGGRALLARFPEYETAMAFAAVAVVVLAAAGSARERVGIKVAALAAVAGVGLWLLGRQDLLGLGEGIVTAVIALVALGRPSGLAGGWLGLLTVALLAALVVQIAAPTAAFVVQWPLAAAAACAAGLGLARPRGPLATSLAALTSVLVLTWLGALFHALLQGLDVPELPAATLWLGALAIWPHAWPDPTGPRNAVIGSALLAAGLAIALHLGLTTPWSARHPRASEPLLVLDQDAGRAWRVSPLEPDPWTRSTLTADGGAVGRRSFPAVPTQVWAAPSRPVAIPPSPLAVTQNADGSIELRAPSPSGGLALVELRSTAAAIDAAVDGQPAAILQRPGAWTRFRWQAAPAGLTVSFRPEGHGVLEARYAIFQAGWPPGATPLPPMPPDVMAWDMAGSTVAAGTKALSW